MTKVKIGRADDPDVAAKIAAGTVAVGADQADDSGSAMDEGVGRDPRFSWKKGQIRILPPGEPRS